MLSIVVSNWTSAFSSRCALYSWNCFCKSLALLATPVLKGFLTFERSRWLFAANTIASVETMTKWRIVIIITFLPWAFTLALKLERLWNWEKFRGPAAENPNWLQRSFFFSRFYLTFEHNFQTLWAQRKPGKHAHKKMTAVRRSSPHSDSGNDSKFRSTSEPLPTRPVLGSIVWRGCSQKEKNKRIEKMWSTCTLSITNVPSPYYCCFYKLGEMRHSRCSDFRPWACVRGTL